ncbi:MAG: double-strand break repair helicase AddA [Alphaproteobacteria bacterium]|nr:double-strand break repair helicase AddA [Alphaproteobacteria bacterium]
MTAAPNPSPGADAKVAQRKAADTKASVWVGASAGTGKTKVLTDRVLSLLLAGTPPQRILCLTFTRAAAAEMANRVREALGLWATDSEEELDRSIEDLTGSRPDPELSGHARGLFGAVLDCPGGLKIQTIHAFCESLLRRFPVEAGVQPHFRLMDERTARELLALAGDEVLARAMNGAEEGASGDGIGLASALAAIAGEVNTEAFHKLMDRLANDRARLARMLNRTGGLIGAARAMAARLDIDPGTRAEDLIAAACADAVFDGPGLGEALAVMAEGQATDRKRAGAMAPFLAADAGGRPGLLEEYRKGFLRADGQAFARFITEGGLKGVDHGEALLAIMAAEAERLMALAGSLNALANYHSSVAAVTLGAALVEAYDAHKHARARLDYEDLILKTRDLLEGGTAAQWVLFKLDGGLDHILVDEAQDTSPDQWGVIKALAEDFFSGAGARDDHRTVFAVGDAKQSIYSFQRADPRAFEEMRAFFRTRVEDAAQRWQDVDLHVSFRSTAAVLNAVDAVFANDPAGQGLGPPGMEILHRPDRDGMAGLVEMWPLMASDKPSPADPWTPAMDLETGFDAPARLARVIAVTIKNWIADKEMLPARGRAIEAGDVMVLVRRRTGFVEALVRELKRLDVPVAGVDRMVVTNQLAVMDLVAVGRFALLPEDDLNLACVLKGPFLGFDEDALFDLAHGRKGTLWAALRAHARTDERLARARDWLGVVLGRADFERPYEFFAAILNRGGGREKLLARLGREAADPVNEFLELALAYEQMTAPSLEGFLAWACAGEVEIKRDLEQAVRNEVRVMTVHAAKGLEAPIVFLPDTTRNPPPPDLPYWTGPGDGSGPGLPLWAPRVAEFGADLTALRARGQADQLEETHRLLYVAMTRAEDRLYVCGWQTTKMPAQGCWYDLIRAGLEGMAGIEEVAVDFTAGIPGLMVTGRRLSCPQDAPAKAGDRSPDHPVSPLAAAWADLPPAPEPARAQPLAPSDPGEEPPILSPAGAGGDWFLRGRVVHGLLEHLPELPPGARAAAARAYLARATFGLDAQTRAEIAAETLALLDDPAFAPLFGPGSLAEVPVAGVIGDIAVSGQIDRVVVGDGTVLVVDYKTGRHCPDDAAGVPPAYLRQMALYRALLQLAFPGFDVRAALVFTTVPKLLALPGAALDKALGALIRPT